MESLKKIVCVGNGWFPNMAGGLNRYVYELVEQLAAAGDTVELCGVGLPKEEANPALKLTNLAEPDYPIWQRFWLTRNNFLERQIKQPDAINLHFALYCLPLLMSLPKDVPITFTFHGPWAQESQREGANKLNTIAKLGLEKMVYRRCDRFIVLSQAFGTILHEDYQVPWDKIHVIPGGVDIEQFNSNLSRQEARTKLNFPQDRKILFTPRR